MDEVYAWMEEIRIVKGYNRTCLYDLPRRDYRFVPNDIGYLINKIVGQPVNNKNGLTKNEIEWINELISLEYLVTVPKKLFPLLTPLNLNWEHPSIIVNAVIEDGGFLGTALECLDDLLCKHLLIICSSSKRMKEILGKFFSVTNFQQVEFIIKNQENLDIEILRQEYPVLGQIFFEGNTIDPTTENLNSASIPKSPYLKVDIDLYLEAQKFNPYFNRKMYIASNGAISNSESAENVLGTISKLEDSDSLEKIIISDTFNKYGEVNKDICDVCKDCEFRYMCIDSRVPVKRKNMEWYYLDECDYNPYICTWNGDSGYLNLRESGVNSTDCGVHIDQEKVEHLFLEIWSK